MNTTPGLTRTVISRNYALITPDGHVPSTLPGWTNCATFVLISSALGAGLSQYLMVLDSKGAGVGETENDEWFFYVVTGKARVNDVALGEGGFACLPPGARFEVRGAVANSKLLVFKKRFEALAGQKPRAFFSGNEKDIPEKPFLGDKHARLKTLIPDTLAADMAVNIFTFDPGATLPFVETHVMEHGMLFLSGGGIYRLDAGWHPVTEGDALWISPYCPQWFIAAGPKITRYIYCKNVNRLPQ